MRIWISEPTANGLVTRQLHWTECLSDHGRQVQSAGAALIGFCIVVWVYSDFNAILAAAIVWLIVAWIWKRIMLGLYPRQFSEVALDANAVRADATEEPIEPAAPPKCQPWGTYRS